MVKKDIGRAVARVLARQGCDYAVERLVPDIDDVNGTHFEEQACGLPATHVLTKVDRDGSTGSLSLCVRHAKPRRLIYAQGNGWVVTVLPKDVAPPLQSA